MWCRIWPLASSKPMPRPSTPTLLLMVLRFFVPFSHQRANQIFGNPAQAEPAYHDGGAVEYIGNSLFRAGDDFIHRNVILLEPTI